MDWKCTKKLQSKSILRQFYFVSVVYDNLLLFYDRDVALMLYALLRVYLSVATCDRPMKGIIHETLFDRVSRVARPTPKLAN